MNFGTHPVQVAGLIFIPRPTKLGWAVLALPRMSVMPAHRPSVRIFVSGADLGNLLMGLFYFALTHPLGSVDVIKFNIPDIWCSSTITIK